MSKITIVGIDPSMRNTGLARAEVDVITLDWSVTALLLASTQGGKDGKVVRKSSDDLRRGKHLHTEMQAFLAGADMAVAEVPTGTQSARGSFSNGLCCGLLASVPVPMIEVNPTEVKLASAGHKYGAKEEIIEWAVAKWPHLPWRTRKVKGEVHLLADNEHLADACAAIAAGLKSEQFKQAVSMMRVAMRASTPVAA